MVPSGDPTKATITELGDLLSVTDLVVDGGNSNYRESIARSEELAAKGIGFVDAGVSGGVWGLENGYGLMVGGSDEHVGQIRPVLWQTMPFDGVADAHQLMHENKHLGKIAILVGATEEGQGKTEDGPGAIRAEVGA